MTSPEADPAAGFESPATTKEGWAAFVNHQPAPVDLLGPAELAALTPARRDAYDEIRIEHHARLIVVATPTVERIVKTGRRLTVLNRGQDTARRGLVVTGESS